MRVADFKLDELVPSKSLRTGNIDVDELTESIREHGLLQPIRCGPLADSIRSLLAIDVFSLTDRWVWTPSPLLWSRSQTNARLSKVLWKTSSVRT